MKRFCLFISLLCLCGCSSLKMETDPQIVFIDSNVTAWVYDGNVRLGETPFFGKIERSWWTELTLQKTGYKTVKVPLQRRMQRKFFQLTGTERALAASSFYVTGFGLPALTDMSGTTFGFWVEYMPNAYYVELEPNDAKHASANEMKQREIKLFALKNFSGIAARNPEHLNAFHSMTGLNDRAVADLIDKNPQPSLFAKAAANLARKE